MKTKTAIAVIALVLLVGVSGALYYSGVLGARHSTEQEGLPHVSGTLTAVSPDSVTVTDDNGKAVTLTANAETKVVTQVAAGETGKTLEQLPLQAHVLVVLDEADRTVAGTITPIPQPFFPPEGAMATSTEGTVVSKTATGLTIRQDDGLAVEVRVGPSTKVLSNVLAGEKGAGFDSLSAGDRVGIVGTVSADEGPAIDVLQIGIIKPLAPAAAAGAAR